MAHFARYGPHRTARRADPLVQSYEIGERVLLKTTEQAVTITGRTSWGDYTLRELDGYFSPLILRRIRADERPSS
jgi:hypothetical protein